MAFAEALKIEFGKDSYCAKLAPLDVFEGLYVVDLASAEPTFAVALKNTSTHSCSIWKYRIEDTSILNYVSELDVHALPTFLLLLPFAW
jgi:hypothetical protein